MLATGILGLPYPEAADSPNGAAQIQALAEKLDGLIQRNRVAAVESTSSSSATTLSSTDEVTVSVPATYTPVSVHAWVTMTPSASGDAKVWLYIDGVSYGTIMTGTANTGAQTRFAIPGSTTGLLSSATLAVGGWLAIATLTAGSHTIGLRFSSTAGSASFSNRLLIAKVG